MQIRGKRITYTAASILIIIVLIIIEYFVFMNCIQDAWKRVIFSVISILSLIYVASTSWLKRSDFINMEQKTVIRKLRFLFISTLIFLTFYIGIALGFRIESNEYEGQPFIVPIFKTSKLKLELKKNSYDTTLVKAGFTYTTNVIKKGRSGVVLFFTELFFLIIYIGFSASTIELICKKTLLLFRNTEINNAIKKGATIIKLFLASSSELKQDRKEFREFISVENDQLIERELYIQLVQWEYFIDAMSKTRLQDEYNLAIKESDIFVSLFFTKIGKYTEEEFDNAFKKFRKSGKPYIYTYFKNSTKRDTEKFKQKISEFGHFYTTYSSIPELQLHFKRQLEKLIPILKKQPFAQN